jgi:light-regulated signal transduction histidine kinase (bacteriophytochrome)
MQGFAAALKGDYGGKIDADADRMIEKIVANAEAMSHLIDDLLAFSHLGTAPVSRENVNMQQLATLVTGELLQDAPAGKYAMHIQQLPPVYADGAMLKQVLTNLIGNAVKYSAKKEHPVIEVGCEEEGEKTIYYVKDNGAGFNMTYVDKLFGVFQRLHSQQEFAGTGVGLALVRRIIDKHGGEIWAEAAEGQGAAFYFTLPYIN